MAAMKPAEIMLEARTVAHRIQTLESQQVAHLARTGKADPGVKATIIAYGSYLALLINMLPDGEAT